MTPEQFEQLQKILRLAYAEATNDETLADWLIDVGGKLIAMGVELMSDEEGEDWKNETGFN